MLSPIPRWFTTILTAIALCLTLAIAPAVASPAPTTITVYRDPGCSCCGGWMDQLSEQGFAPDNVPTEDMDALKQQYGIPEDMASCHTAVVDGYLIEGHVPVADIQQLLAQQPQGSGIAVPGMPIGTPGMEDGDRHDPFTVFLFDQGKEAEVFNTYPDPA